MGKGNRGVSVSYVRESSPVFKSMIFVWTETIKSQKIVNRSSNFPILFFFFCQAALSFPVTQSLYPHHNYSSCAISLEALSEPNKTKIPIWVV